MYILSGIVFFVTEKKQLINNLEDHPYGFISDGKIFRKGFLDFPEKKIGEIKESAEASIRYFEDRFEIARKKVADLEKQIETHSNKGSFLMKLIHMRDYLVNYDGLGNFTELFERLDEQERFLKEVIHQNRIKNTEIKKALLADMEVLKDHFNILEAWDRICEIKNKWIRTGMVLEEQKENLESGFASCLEHFNDRRNEFYSDKRKMVEETVEKYRNIISRAHSLNVMPDVRRAADQLKKLQMEWKNLNKIPPELYHKLKDEFQQVNEMVFGRLKEERKIQILKRDELVREIITKKGKLIEELQENLKKNIKDFSSIREKFLDDWRQTGNIYNAEINALNKEFRYLIMKTNEILFVERLAEKKNRKYKELDQQEKNNIKIRLLHDLIERDKREIAQYSKNLEVYNLKSDSIDRMINNKLQNKLNSLEIKKNMYDSLISKKSGS